MRKAFNVDPWHTHTYTHTYTHTHTNTHTHCIFGRKVISLMHVVVTVLARAKQFNKAERETRKRGLGSGVIGKGIERDGVALPDLSRWGT